MIWFCINSKSLYSQFISNRPKYNKEICPVNYPLGTAMGNIQQPKCRAHALYNLFSSHISSPMQRRNSSQDTTRNKIFCRCYKSGVITVLSTSSPECTPVSVVRWRAATRVRRRVSGVRCRCRSDHRRSRRRTHLT